MKYNQKIFFKSSSYFSYWKTLQWIKFLIKYIIDELDNYIKYLKYNMNYLTKSNEIENIIINHLDIEKGNIQEINLVGKILFIVIIFILIKIQIKLINISENFFLNIIIMIIN